MGLVKINEVLNYKGKNYRRISLRKIKSLCNQTLFKQENKITLCVIPCNARLGYWVDFLQNTFIGGTIPFTEVEKWLNAVEYYNCNNEMGNRLHYYILEE